MMAALSLSAAALVLCVWTYLLLGRGFFWRVSIRPTEPFEVTARIVVIIPARNEADAIGQSVKSLLTQSIADLHIVLVDDGSSDGTAAAARAIATQMGLSKRLTVIPGKPLPAGWTGKVWAMQQGTEKALEFHPDYLLYSDADIEHGQNAISTLIAMAERDQVDLASYMVKLHCSTIAERLLIPAFVYFFFQLYPPVWIADPKAKTAGAAGGCMLVRPTTLQRAGGIEAIRSEIIDDCALARIIKRSGGRLWLGVSATSRSLRPYVGFADIGRMIARTAFNQLHHSALLLLATCVGLFLTYLFPVALLWRLTFGWPTLASVARVGLSIPFAFMTLSYLPMVRFYRLNPLWALTLPIAAIFYMGATVSSAVHYWSGRGGQWKGRAQDVRAVAK